MSIAAARPTDERRADYHSYGRQEQFIVPLLGRLIDGALQRHAAVAPRSGARVLDIGCGAQPMRATLEARGFQYVGVDVVQNAAGTVDVLAPIDVPLPPALADAPPFDLILCTEVMEHVADWEASFANFARLLAPGGRLVLTCPFIWQHHEEPYDFWRPTVHAIAAYARRAGLDVVELEAAGTYREALGTMLAAMRIEFGGRSGPSVWLRRRLLGVAREVALRVLRGNWFRGDVHIEGNYHLTTFAVLGRPAANGSVASSHLGGVA